MLKDLGSWTKRDGWPEPLVKSRFARPFEARLQGGDSAGGTWGHRNCGVPMWSILRRGCNNSNWCGRRAGHAATDKERDSNKAGCLRVVVGVVVFQNLKSVLDLYACGGTARNYWGAGC